MRALGRKFQDLKMYFKLCIWCVCGASHASHALSKTTLQLMEMSGVAGLLPGAAGLPGCCRGAAGVLPGAAGCCRVLPGVAGYLDLPSHRLSWSVRRPSLLGHVITSRESRDGGG